MRVSERKTSTPVGLSRFLVRHREHEGFETLRDDSLITVVCSGCEASFSYLKPPAPEETPAEIDEALARITGGGNGVAPASDEPVAEDRPPARERRRTTDRRARTRLVAPERRTVPETPETPERRAVPEPPDPPASTSGNGAGAHEAGDSPVSPAERLHEPHPFRTMGRSRPPVPARRLAPPGPHAPRRRRNPTVTERVLPAAREGLDRAVAWAVPRRRTIALTALAIAGAYLFVSLSLGDDASSSSPPSAPPDSPAAVEQAAAPAPPSGDPATPDEGAISDDARPLESFQAGGPDVEDKAVAPGNFSVALPPDWSRGFADDGSTLFAAADGGGEVIVQAQPRGAATYGQMTDEAASYLATRVDPGTPIARPVWKRVGNLLSVAVASEPDGHNEIAYIGVTPTTRYLVVRSIEPHASALVRLQADGIVSSLTAQ
jgi:hypothetical protein